ncbi:hypothetical protein D3C71_1911400 [compost metagenome]
MKIKIIFDYSKLKGKIKEVFDTQTEYATQIGISATSLCSKLNGRTYFNQEQIKKSILLLNIPLEEIALYFFTQKV